MRDGSEEDRAPADEAPLPVTLRRLLLLGPPLLLAAFEIVHPRPDQTAADMLDVANWFLAFHAVQLPLIALVALSVLLLAQDLERAAAWTTRLGLGVFLVFFSAYDALAGMGTGLAMRNARHLRPAEQEAVWEAVKDWPGLEAFAFPLAVVGTLGWVVAVGALAVAARRAGAPRYEWVPLALAAMLLLGGHPAPFGTLAFGSLFVAALVRERRSRRAPSLSAVRA